MSGRWDGLTDDQRALAELVATPSVSGTERAAAGVFVRHAAALGLDAEIDEAGNAIGHRGASATDAAARGVHIVLLGHIDTAPGEIPVRVEDGVLHGRGSVDAKGPLAAMLCAAARAEIPDGVRLTVAGAVGEETTGSLGARFLVGQYRPDACIIGEPSGWDGVTLGYKGRLIARATASVPGAHSASGEASASDLVFAWWRAVLGATDRRNAGAAGAFDAVQATIQRLTSDSDGLASTATLEGGFRLPVGVDPDDLAAELRALAPDEITIRFLGAEVAHETDRNDPVVRALSGAIREQGARPRPKRKTGTADLNVVAPVWRCPIAAYGPGDSSLDHTPGERLPLAEFDRAVAVLTSAIGSLAHELLEARAARDPAATQPAALAEAGKADQ